MDTSSKLHMLIVDDEEPVCDVLRTMVSSWGISAKSLTDAHLVADELRHTFYDLILLDLHMPEVSGLELLASISGLCPKTKIIVMAGYADKEMVISALRSGTFDFLEKPIPAEELRCAVKRALEDQHNTHVPKKTSEEFWQNQEVGVSRAEQLALANNESIEANKKVITALTGHMNDTQPASEQRPALHLQALVIPLLEKLRQDIHLEPYEAQLTMAIRYIQDLTSSATMTYLGNSALTLTELRVASMIKQGLRSGDIATCLGISPHTVKTHRRNIRKKLHIVGTKKPLAPYLATFEATPSRPTPGMRHDTNARAY